MNSQLDRPMPTIADEASPVVDDRVVIEKTLPVTPPMTAVRPDERWDRLLASTRHYVGANPGKAALMAAAGGALLAELLVMSLGRRRR